MGKVISEASIRRELEMVRDRQAEIQEELKELVETADALQGTLDHFDDGVDDSELVDFPIADLIAVAGDTWKMLKVIADFGGGVLKTRIAQNIMNRSEVFGPPETGRGKKAMWRYINRHKDEFVKIARGEYRMIDAPDLENLL